MNCGKGEPMAPYDSDLCKRLFDNSLPEADAARSSDFIGVDESEGA